jgi:uncharacterized membrane protein
MPGVGPAEIVVSLLTLGVYVGLGAAILAVALRIIGVRSDPQRVLQKRLARGEITQAEFEEASRIIGR